MSHLHLVLPTCEVRSWRASDADSLVVHANNRKVWLNLRDRFPHPYTKRHARAFLRSARSDESGWLYAIAVGGQAIGGIGLARQTDVERMSAEIGYWLGEAFWGRGIATDAVAAVTVSATERYGVTRIFAHPFASNVASCRVLEKAGYTLEARLRRSAIKDGVIVDQCQYAFIAPESAP